MNIRFQTIFLHLLVFSILFSQEALEKPRSFSPLTKKVFSFSKLDFVTAEGEFNEAICTLKIPELVTDSPPFIAIYYRRENSCGLQNLCTVKDYDLVSKMVLLS